MPTMRNGLAAVDGGAVPYSSATGRVDTTVSAAGRAGPGAGDGPSEARRGASAVVGALVRAVVEAGAGRTERRRDAARREAVGRVGLFLPFNSRCLSCARTGVVSIGTDGEPSPVFGR